MGLLLLPGAWQGPWDHADARKGVHLGGMAHPRDVFGRTLMFLAAYKLAVSSEGTNWLRNVSLQPSLICPVNLVLAFPRSYLAPWIY